MKILQIIYLLFPLLLKGFDSFSQQPVFMPVPPPGGGSCGTQDSRGYMWFGSSNGLHRYDGYNYKSYFNEPKNSSSLALNRIGFICADRNDFIWVGTKGNGLDRLDPETGIFTHFRHNPSNPTSISNDTITAIIEDKDGKIWVGTDHSGLNCLDPKTGIFTRFRHNPNDKNSLSNDIVTTLYETLDGTIWVGTGLPLKLKGDVDWKKGGLNRFNPANRNFTRFLHDPKDSFSLIDNRVGALFEDSKGKFWVGTAGDGLHTMNREKGSFERHQYNVLDSNGLSRPPVRNTLTWTDDLITFIREDAAGSIWIGTFSGGLNRYDFKTRKISHYASLKENSTNKNEEIAFLWSYASKDGVLWISAWDGLYRLDPLHKPIPHYDAGSPVRSLLQDGTGKLWLGTTEGLVLFDSAGTNKKRFVHKKADTMSLSSDNVHPIFKDREGIIWIGTDSGLNRYDNQSQKFAHYLKNLAIHFIYEDRKGSFWLGTNEGLVLMNRQVGTFNYYRQSTSDTTSLSQDLISAVGEDKEGYLWIGTFSRGLNRFDQRSKKFQHYLPGTYIHSIFEDADSVLWIGTNRGLYYFKPSNNSFELFTNQGAGIPGNMAVFNILEDDQQSLWINTRIGLFRLRHNRSEASFFGKRYGIIPPTQATQVSCFKGKRGELFFADNIGNGYYAFFPEQLKGNAFLPDLHITGFKIGDQLVNPGKSSPLRLPLSQTKEIRLNNNQNVFSFDFAGIHYSSPEDNQHLFMLENLDNDWRKAGEEKSAYYYNVPPGDYVFHVRASNSNGVWTEKSIIVIISPPWLKTWWAYGIYVLLLMTVLVAIHRIQKKRVIEKEREKTRERELAQAKEIEKAYHELQNTQAQLIQREKMASLGELTAGIAHEIQNPLNFVNNFSDINTELVEELHQEIDKGNIQEVKAIANDIKENEQKINRHGKRADAIVKGMLQHSRSSSGVKEPTNINALADEYLRLAYNGLRTKDNSFNATIKTGFDYTIGNINIIPQDIGRVILNLINNAFYAVTEKNASILRQAQDSAGQPYEPTVSVSTKKVNSKVEIGVKDNGNGIPQKVLDKIFQPFFTTKPAGQGTGLGLSLAYDIIKAHGGEIKVKTEENKGSEFIIILPL